MRRLITFVLLIVIILAGIFSYGLVRLYLEDSETVIPNPLLRPVRNLILQVTPEILPDKSIIINQVSRLARLETASFEGEKVVTSERDTDVLFGVFGESMVFVAHGQVIAGIDMGKMGEADIQVVDPTTVMVHLPEAEILVATLDNEQSYVVDRDVGLFTGADPQLETQVRQIGEQAVLEAALEFGILEDAEKNAQDYLETFLTELGFETVVFTEETPPTPEPYIQEVPKGRVIATPEP